MSIEQMSEVKPYLANVNGTQMWLVRGYEDRNELIKVHSELDPLRVGLVAIAMFHNRRDREYIAVSQIDEKGDEYWTKDFHLREMLIWMGGVALDAEDRKILHLADRNNGSFAETHSWRPDVIVEWEPSEQEEEAFIEHELQDLDRATGMPIEFFEGNEDGWNGQPWAVEP